VLAQLGPFEASELVFDSDTVLVKLIYDDSEVEAFVASRSLDHWNVVWRIGDVQSLGMDRLPDTADGRHRFYVEQPFFHEAGCGITDTLGIWRIDREGVVRLLSRSFPTYCGETEPFSLVKQVLHIPVKRQFKSIVVGSSDPGRQMDWRIAIGPYGLKDLGETSTAPALDAIDELFHRLFRGLPTADLASDRAVANLKPTARYLVESETAKIAASGGPLRPNELQNFPFLGELIVRPDHNEGKNLCVEVSGWDQDKAFSFDVRKIKNRLFIDNAEMSACSAPDH
jgi:hypothetical protein